MIGHIKIDRKILNWEWYQDITVFHLFLYLLLKASHKDTKWKGQDIKRGQLVFGRLKCSKDTGLSEQNVRTCISKLKSTREITSNPTNKFTVITICKYDFYQSGEFTTNQQINQQNVTRLTNNQPTTNQQLTTYNNDKEYNNDKKVNNIYIPAEKIILWESEKKSFLNAGDWIFKFCTDKNISVDDFDCDAKIFISDVELKEDFKEAKELKRHFTNWYNLKHKKNGHKFINGTEKTGTSSDRVAALKKWG